VRERVEEAAGHTRGDDGVAVGDVPDGPDELGRQDVLQDKAAGAETERPERVLIQDHAPAGRISLAGLEAPGCRSVRSQAGLARRPITARRTSGTTTASCLAAEARRTA
jgi:hypothetical protein